MARNAKAFAPGGGQFQQRRELERRRNRAACSTCFRGGTQRSVRFGLTDGSRQTLWETNEPVARVHMTPDEQELIYDTGRPRNIWKLHIKGDAGQATHL